MTIKQAALMMQNVLESLNEIIENEDMPINHIKGGILYDEMQRSLKYARKFNLREKYSKLTFETRLREERHANHS